MPLEIRELVIKVTIDENQKKPPVDISEKLEKLRDEVVSKCYEKIINKLEGHSER